MIQEGQFGPKIHHDSIETQLIYCKHYTYKIVKCQNIIDKRTKGVDWYIISNADFLNKYLKEK